jgi:hypothetical protein
VTVGRLLANWLILTAITGYVFAGMDACDSIRRHLAARGIGPAPRRFYWWAGALWPWTILAIEGLYRTQSVQPRWWIPWYMRKGWLAKHG